MKKTAMMVAVVVALAGGSARADSWPEFRREHEAAYAFAKENHLLHEACDAAESLVYAAVQQRDQAYFDLWTKRRDDACKERDDAWERKRQAPAKSKDAPAAPATKT